MPKGGTTSPSLVAYSTIIAKCVACQEILQIISKNYSCSQTALRFLFSSMANYLVWGQEGLRSIDLSAAEPKASVPTSIFGGPPDPQTHTDVNSKSPKIVMRTYLSPVNPPGSQLQRNVASCGQLFYSLFEEHPFIGYPVSKLLYSKRAGVLKTGRSQKYTLVLPQDTPVAIVVIPEDPTRPHEATATGARPERSLDMPKKWPCQQKASPTLS